MGTDRQLGMVEFRCLTHPGNSEPEISRTLLRGRHRSYRSIGRVLSAGGRRRFACASLWAWPDSCDSGRLREEITGVSVRPECRELARKRLECRERQQGETHKGRTNE